LPESIRAELQYWPELPPIITYPPAIFARSSNIASYTELKIQVAGSIPTFSISEDIYDRFVFMYSFTQQAIDCYPQSVGGVRL